MSEERQIDEQARTRRSLLRLAGVGAAGVAASAAFGAPQDANAADGGALTLGQTNAATNKTELDTSGTIASDGAFKVVAPNADYGVIGSAKVVGAFGSGAVGVLGDGAVGGQFSGTDAAINLEPRTQPGPPGGTNVKGDLIIDSQGVLYLCIAGGTPGTWIPVSHGGTRLLNSPQRAYDSRNTGGIFAAGETRDVSIAAVLPSGVQSVARGFVGNIAVTGTQSSFGWVTAYPAGTPYPGTASINWSFVGQTLNNATTVGLGTGAGNQGKITLYASSPTHVIVDVSAYIL
jgi:hypothetical protein